MIGFLSPWMAWGAIAAVGLPLLAHMLSKTRYREVVFPAARLVQRAVAATSRIETPRHRLLMLLRFLALLLLVLAFMRPQWTPDAKANTSDRGIALILLLDASASMQRSESGATLYDRALREAQRLIGQLDPSRDIALLYRIDHAPASLLPEATAQLRLLADRADATVPGYTHANWASAVADAQRFIADETRAIRIVTISDQQGGQPDLRLLTDGQPDVTVSHVRLDGPIDNSAIRLLDIRPYPPTKGQPITVDIEVKHFGDQPRSATLTARFQGTQTKQSIDLNPGSTQRILLRLPTQTSDAGLLQVTLDRPDAMSADNTAGVWLTTQQQPRVLVIHDPGFDSQRRAYRIGTLINPGELAGRTQPQVVYESIATAGPILEEADPADLRTVVLINEMVLPDALSEQLEAYAQGGGGVIQFVADDDPTAQTTTAANIDFELEPLRVFEGPARAGLASLVWPGVSNRLIDPLAKPILIDDLERVIVAEMLRGRGRLIAINAALSDAGGLLAEPGFVVLFNELCRYASPGPALPMPFRPGQAMPGVLRDAYELRLPQDAQADGQVLTVPGAYAALSPGGAITDLIHVELDPSESDTSPTPGWSDINATSQRDRSSASGAEASTGALIRENPVELWPYCVLGVLGLIAFESLLLWRFSGAFRPALQGGVA